jgi:hypothetical protein
MIDIRWKLPWEAVGSDAGTSGLQRELEKEVGPNIPCGAELLKSSAAASTTMMFLFTYRMAS